MSSVDRGVVAQEVSDSEVEVAALLVVGLLAEPNISERLCVLVKLFKFATCFPPFMWLLMADVAIVSILKDFLQTLQNAENLSLGSTSNQALKSGFAIHSLLNWHP